MKRISRLETLFPPFANLVRQGLMNCNAHGIPLRAFETYRSWERQESLYAHGRTEPGQKVTNARAGESWHNYGLAVDLVLMIDGKWTWNHTELYKKAPIYFEPLGLEWLGRSKRFPELVHYQFPTSFTISSAKGLAKKGGGILSVWNEILKVI